MKKHSRKARPASAIPRKKLRCPRIRLSTLEIYRESRDFHRRLIGTGMATFRGIHLGLTPCRSHHRMKGPLRDGETGFLRSLASALEADSPHCRRGRSRFFLAGDLFCLRRSAQRTSARPFLANRKKALPCSERKGK